MLHSVFSLTNTIAGKLRDSVWYAEGVPVPWVLWLLVGGNISGQEHPRGLGSTLPMQEVFFAFNFRVKLLGVFAQYLSPARMLLKASRYENPHLNPLSWKENIAGLC